MLTSAPSGYWSSIASNSTGQFLAAAQYRNSSYDPGGIYTSTSGIISY
jgi:hypothetical protein